MYCKCDQKINYESLKSSKKNISPCRYQLRFDDQVKFICKKVNSITELLCKSSYLFTDKIKPSLFKLFYYEPI